MYHVKVLKAADAEAAGRLAADQLQQAVCAKPACVLGLATGATPIPLYRELIRREQAGLMDFSRVRSVNLDEYKGLAPDHPQSYRRFMQENLFDHISIRPENTWVPDGMTTDVDAMCDGYERTIEELGGVDLQLLDEVPTAAYTMGVGTVMAARRVLMIVTGADKADILHRAFCGPVTPWVPASILQFHPDVTLICDEAAWSGMKA